MEAPVSFGEWLKERRKLLDLTQADLANRVGCSVMTIRKIEADERRPSRQIAELLAGCLEIAPEAHSTFIKVARAELRVERLPQNVRTLDAISLSDKHAAASPLFPSAAGGNRGEAAPELVEGGSRGIGEGTLPSPPTPLVGREHELAAIRRLLQEPHCRLLSLIGPGGIGKTRLAIAVASQLEEFDDGVYFVALAPLSGSEFIVPTIAAAIGFTFYGATAPQTQLFNYLREKRLLLILDNLEHLLDGVDLLTELLQHAPALKVLATSRERLNLQGEWVFEVQGLPVPSGDELGGLVENSATRLFLQSAQRAQVGFEIPPEEWQAVARICRFMEGLPLGIELAASWVRLLSCREIALEIERNLDFLALSTRDAPARHHSIRAVFDHSWKLLSAEEQRALRQLSVFRGGFRREAAAQVAGASLRELAGLVDKSLVSAPTPLSGGNAFGPPASAPAAGGGREGGRYYLHELVRQFSADKLAAMPEEQATTRTRHSDYFLGFLQEREAGLTGKAQKTVMDEIQAEIENVRMAWNWAVSQGRSEAIDRALDSLNLFYWRRSHYQEGEETFRRIVEHLQQLPELRSPPPAAGLRPEAPPEPVEGGSRGVEETPLGKLYMKALALQGALCRPLGQTALAGELLQKSLGLARRWGAKAEIAFCLNFLGDTVWEQGDYLAAESLYLESLAVSRAMNHPLSLAEVLTRLGWLNATTKGDYPTAQNYLQQSLDLMRQMENQAGIALLLDRLGYTVFQLGDYSASEQYYGESLALFKELGDRLGMAMAIGGLGLAAWGVGGDRLNEAKQLFEKSLAICREIGHQSQVQIRLALVGHICNSLGSYEEATDYLQQGWDLAKQLGKQSEVSSIVGGLGEAALGLENLGMARGYLLEALQSQRVPVVLVALINWAALLKKEADLQDPPQSPLLGGRYGGRKQQAVEILSLALNHPSTIEWYKNKAIHLLAELEAELPSQVAAAAREQGQTQTIEEMVAKIVGQTESLPSA
jgi:predicted ATPase/transcriptional regulator with XRE-family HTH domain